MGLCVEERECKLRESGECSCKRGDTLAGGGTAHYAQRREMGSLGGQVKRRNRERDSCGTTYKNPAVSGLWQAMHPIPPTVEPNTRPWLKRKQVLGHTVFGTLTLPKNMQRSWTRSALVVCPGSEVQQYYVRQAKPATTLQSLFPSPFFGTPNSCFQTSYSSLHTFNGKSMDHPTHGPSRPECGIELYMSHLQALILVHRFPDPTYSRTSRPYFPAKYARIPTGRISYLPELPLCPVCCHAACSSCTAELVPS